MEEMTLMEVSRVSVSEEHMQEIATELGLKLQFNSKNPGVLNTTTGEHRTLDSYFGILDELTQNKL
jgi:hypothetical protein